MPSSHVIRLGTRGSPLARWQADWVAARLAAEGAKVEMVEIVTRGDRQDWGPIAAAGAQGAFTKEIQRALLERHIDLAVHSLKDLPTEPVEGLCLAAVPERESSNDVLVSGGGLNVDQLQRGARIGTGSIRRRAQLWHLRRDLAMLDIRGNVETRLRKLDEGQFDAIVLAAAGLKRLGLAGRISQVLPPAVMLPAIGQGALGLEARRDDQTIQSLLARLDHAPTHLAVVAERAMLSALRGGCLAPVAALARFEPDGRLHLTGAVLSADGAVRLEAACFAEMAEVAGPTDDSLRAADRLGRQAADELLAQGAAALIQAAR